MSFAQEVRLFSFKATRLTDEARRAICLALFRSVILDTPVLSGRLRGNWQTSVAQPKQGSLDRLDKPGQQAIDEAQSNLGDGQNTDITVFMVNNLPYAHRIEYEGWSHTKAPEGMVRRNALRIANNVKKAIAEGKL